MYPLVQEKACAAGAAGEYFRGGVGCFEEEWVELKALEITASDLPSTHSHLPPLLPAPPGVVVCGRGTHSNHSHGCAAGDFAVGVWDKGMRTVAGVAGENI